MSDKEQASSKNEEQDQQEDQQEEQQQNQQEDQQQDQQPEPSPTNRQDPQHHLQECKTKLIIDHVKAHTIDVALWIIRLLTIFFALKYALGIQNNAFRKVLLANIAISVLRLYQRLGRFSLSRIFLTRLMLEDSCHYIMYSLIFFNSKPNILILVPIFLFAMLHASSYSLTILKLLQIKSMSLTIRIFFATVKNQTANILKIAAFSEIFLLPVAAFSTFVGQAGLMAPVMYYHFLQLRYTSHRNPYTREAFKELRILAEAAAQRSPPVVHNIIYKGIRFVSRLVPHD